MPYICVIPCKLSSERLPAKNILPVRNKPMVVRAFESAFRSGLFESIVVSTEFGFKHPIRRLFNNSCPFIIERPQSMPKDSTCVDVCLDALNKKFDGGKRLCCLYATSGQMGISQYLLAADMLMDELNLKSIQGPDGSFYMVELNEFINTHELITQSHRTIHINGFVDINTVEDYCRIA